MKTRILIMRPDQPHETRNIELPGEPSEMWRLGPTPESRKFYDALRRIVEDIVGGDLEHVTVLADFKGGVDFKRADMFVHETGALDGLPVNGAATAIYRRNAIINMGEKAEDLPAIYGPAVLFEEIVWT